MSCIVGVYPVEHGGINGLCHGIALGTFLTFHPPQSRQQGVGRHTGLHSDALQFGLHQLSVFVFGRGLCHNLPQHFELCLGQVLLLRRLFLCPQRRICLSGKRHRKHHQCHRQGQYCLVHKLHSFDIIHKVTTTDAICISKDGVYHILVHKHRDINSILMIQR